MPLHVSSSCAHHQEVKIALHSLWYHHTYRWPSCAQVALSHPVHETATYRCDDTRGCVMQFWPADDEHMCSKHVEAWNKLIVKQKFCASIWLITEINILRCTVSKTSKFMWYFLCLCFVCTFLFYFMYSVILYCLVHSFSFCAVSFLFLYKSTDPCHKVENKYKISDIKTKIIKISLERLL